MAPLKQKNLGSVFEAKAGLKAAVCVPAAGDPVKDLLALPVVKACVKDITNYLETQMQGNQSITAPDKAKKVERVLEKASS